MNAPLTLPVAPTSAWDIAYHLIEEDNGVTRALDAIEDRDQTMPWGPYDDPVCPFAILGDVADLALAAAEKCRAARLNELADRCMQIDARLRAVCSRGRGDVKQARVDLIRLTASANSALATVPGM